MLYQVSYFFIWAVVLALIPVSVVLLYLLAQLQEQFRRESSGYGNNLIGRKMPVLSVKTPASRFARDFVDYQNERHVVLVINSDCSECRGLAKELALSPPKGLAEIRLVLVCAGNLERCRDLVADIDAAPAYVMDSVDDSNSDVWHAGLPAALMVNGAGIISDVRHPVSIKGLVRAFKTATPDDEYGAPAHRSTIVREESAGIP